MATLIATGSFSRAEPFSSCVNPRIPIAPSFSCMVGLRLCQFDLRLLAPREITSRLVTIGPSCSGISSSIHTYGAHRPLVLQFAPGRRYWLHFGGFRGPMLNESRARFAAAEDSSLEYGRSGEVQETD